MTSRTRSVKLTNNTLRSDALEALTHSWFDAQRVQRFVISLPLLRLHCLPQFRFDCRHSHRHSQLFNLLLNFVSFGPRLDCVRRYGRRKQPTPDWVMWWLWFNDVLCEKLIIYVVFCDSISIDVFEQVLRCRFTLDSRDHAISDGLDP